jgi:hypothetical protein
MGRTAARKGFEQGVRLQLVEEDVDDLEDEIAQAVDKLSAELAKIKGVLLGMLISVTTAALLLAVNLVVARGA